MICLKQRKPKRRRTAPAHPTHSSLSGGVISATPTPQLKPGGAHPPPARPVSLARSCYWVFRGSGRLMIFRGGFGSGSRRCWGSGAADSAPAGSSPADELGLGYF